MVNNVTRVGRADSWRNCNTGLTFGKQFKQKLKRREKTEIRKKTEKNKKRTSQVGMIKIRREPLK